MQNYKVKNNIFLQLQLKEWLSFFKHNSSQTLQTDHQLETFGD